MFSKFCDICQAGRGNVHVTFSVLTLDKNEGERAEGLNDRDRQTENSRKMIASRHYFM